MVPKKPPDPPNQTDRQNETERPTVRTKHLDSLRAYKAWSLRHDVLLLKSRGYQLIKLFNLCFYEAMIIVDEYVPIIFREYADANGGFGWAIGVIRSAKDRFEFSLFLCRVLTLRVFEWGVLIKRYNYAFTNGVIPLY